MTSHLSCRLSPFSVPAIVRNVLSGLRTPLLLAVLWPASAALHAAPLAPAAAVPVTMSANAAGDAVRGVVRARSTAVLSSRLSAQITRMPLQAGQSFRKGDLLVAFDCERQRAEARAAVAAHRAHQKTYDVQRELESHNAIGRMEVEVTRSQMDKAAADVAALEASLRECTVLAPYAGRVVETVAQEHEVAGQGQPLLRIQGAEELELQLIVPSAWMSWLRSGTSFNFRIDETGETMPASVLRTGAAVDPVSQTVKITARLPAGRTNVLPGMSGTADFKRQKL